MAQTPIPARPWLRGLYALGALLLLQPPLEVVAAAWPLRLSEVGWRFGFVGGLQHLISTFVVGMALLALAAYLLQHRLVLRGVAIAALLMGVLLILGMASFALDYVQLRRMVRPELVGKFDMAAMRAGISLLLAIVALSVLGYTGMVASRVTDGRRATRRSSAGEGLIVGRS